ncbi:hypothetical protein [Luethyella okanaganae]|uniref:ATP synthase protein I n=1 Tax=Luethyella okanaganae TaxID=69372 RepID=A0ABW1VL33_9MICO
MTGRQSSKTPSTSRVLRTTLGWGGIVAAVIAVLGAVVGGLLAGSNGVWSALLGAGLALLLMGVTAVTIIAANRYASTPDLVGVYFGIVMGAWLLKFVLFIVLVLALRNQPWLQPTILAVCLIAGVIGSLVVDVIVFIKGRVPYVGEAELRK